jgi:urease accessory protein
MNAVAQVTDNWAAYLKLHYRATEEKTRMIPLRRYGPLSVQRPFYPEQSLCHTYLLHPPGGVVGGDRIDLDIRVEEHAQTLLTTPGATKFYQSSGQTAEIQQTLATEAASTLEFLPQENIYFPGAKVRFNTRVDMNADSRVLMWEKHCLGRPVNHEDFDQGYLRLAFEFYLDGQLEFVETQRIDWQDIQRASGLRGNPVIGSFVIGGEGITDGLLEQCRTLAADPAVCGITRPLDNLMLVRFMGQSTQQLNPYFIRLWELIRPVLLNRKVCYPRIWNT